MDVVGAPVSVFPSVPGSTAVLGKRQPLIYGSAVAGIRGEAWTLATRKSSPPPPHVWVTMVYQKAGSNRFEEQRKYDDANSRP